jgi:hypothetical protein
MVPGNPCCYEVLSNATFSSVTLNPDFAVDDVDVDNAPVYPLCAVPSHGEQEVMVAMAVADHFSLDLAIGVGKLGVVTQNFFDALPIGV